MPEAHTSPFSGFVTIHPPLSSKERNYLNAFKRTRRVDRVQGPYYVTNRDPTSDVNVIDESAPAYGQPSLWCQWEITEDGSRIVFDENEREFEKPLEWMVYLIDHFLRLKPFVMEEFPQVRRDYDIPNFTGHICNGHIQCRGQHNIVVQNNHVGKELCWPVAKMEWLNEPEQAPDSKSLSDLMDEATQASILQHNIYHKAKQDSRDKHYPLPAFEDMVNPLRGFKESMVERQRQSFEEMYQKANKIDEWKEDQPITEITREDVEILKADWIADPIWDLEDTKGFEAYHDELKAFSDAKKVEWEAHRERMERQRIADIHKKAEELGCSFGVAQHIACLEGRIKHLERQVGVLLERSDVDYRKIKGSENLSQLSHEERRYREWISSRPGT